MKKTFFVFKTAILCAVICIAAAFASCGKTAGINDYLLYQRYPFAFSASVEFDGISFEVDAQIRSKTDMTFSVKSPEEVAGTSFSIRDDKTYVGFGDMESEINDGNYVRKNGVLLLCKMFSLSEEQLVRAEVKTESGIKMNLVTFGTNDGNVTVYIDTDGDTPLRFDASLCGHSVRLTVSDFRYI